MYPDADRWPGFTPRWPATRTDLNLIMAVDMPFLQLDFLKYLIAQARESQAVVVVPRAGGSLQPLCAVYRKQLCGSCRTIAAAGKNKIDAFVRRSRDPVIEPEELERNGFGEEMFRNLNTEQDWQEAQAEAVSPMIRSIL